MVEFTVLDSKYHDVPDAPHNHFWRIRLDTDNHSYTLQLVRRGFIFTRVIAESYIEGSIPDTAESILGSL